MSLPPGRDGEATLSVATVAVLGRSDKLLLVVATRESYPLRRRETKSWVHRLTTSKQCVSVSFLLLLVSVGIAQVINGNVTGNTYTLALPDEFVATGRAAALDVDFCSSLCPVFSGEKTAAPPHVTSCVVCR